MHMASSEADFITLYSQQVQNTNDKEK